MAKGRPKMIFVIVYQVEKDGREYMPGEIVRVGEEEFIAWVPTLERSRARMVQSGKEAKALARAIEEGSFVLSEEVSSPHSIQHGGFGKGKEIEGDLRL
jgi:hypothetical protein